MSGSISPTFRLKDITLDNLESISIKDVSEGRSYGRRFHVKCGTKETGDLVFKRIFAKIKRISKSAHSEEEFKKIRKILADLKEVEENSINEYSDKDCSYRFRTWFHRLFNSGSHLEKITHLNNEISKRYAEYANGQFVLLNTAMDKTNKNDLTIEVDNQKFIFSCNKQWWETVVTIQEGQLEDLKVTLRNGVIVSVENSGVSIPSIPEKFVFAINKALLKVQDDASIYTSYQFRVVKQSLIGSPEWHLNQWCQKSHTWQGDQSDHPFRVYYLDERCVLMEGSDMGGLKRDYVDTLVHSLQNVESLFVNLKDSELKLPRMKTDQLSEQAKVTYYHLGQLMWYCFNSKPSSEGSYEYSMLTTGRCFSDSLFAAALSLNADELDLNFDNLSPATQLKMTKILLQDCPFSEDEQKDMEICFALMDENKFNQFLFDCDVDNLLGERDPDKVDARSAQVKEKTLSDTLTKFMVMGGSPEAFEDDRGLCLPDMEKIMANLQEFRKQCAIGMFNKDIYHWNGSSINSVLAPVHAIAQGLKTGAGKANLGWDAAQELNPVMFSEKVQGSISRDHIIENLELAYGCNGDKMQKKLTWLKTWIKEESSDEEIKQFVKFVTGSSSLAKDKKIKITNAALSPYPKSHTCTYTIDIRDTTSSYYLDGTYEGFINCLKEAIAIGDFGVG